MMNRFKKTPIMFSFFYLFIGFLSLESIIAQDKTAKLSRKRYVDPKGNFKIVPPETWRVQEDSQITKSKVAFLGPSADVNLKILINSVNFSNEVILQDVSEKEVNEKMVAKEKQNVADSPILKNDVQDLLKIGYIGFWKKPHFFYKGKKYPLKNQNVKKYSQIISVYPEALNEFNSYKRLHKSASNYNTVATIFTIASCVYTLTHREKYELEPITLPNYSKIPSLNQVNKASSATAWHHRWNTPKKKKEDWTSVILAGTGAVFVIAGSMSEKQARSHLAKSAEIYNQNLKQKRFSFFCHPSNRLRIAVGKSDLFVGFTFSF